jgi:hypothetical protein
MWLHLRYSNRLSWTSKTHSVHVFSEISILKRTSTAIVCEWTHEFCWILKGYFSSFTSFPLWFWGKVAYSEGRDKYQAFLKQMFWRKSYERGGHFSLIHHCFYLSGIQGSCDGWSYMSKCKWMLHLWIWRENLRKRKIFSDFFFKEEVNRCAENCITLILYTFAAMVN